MCMCYLACRPSAYHIGRDQVGIVDIQEGSTTSTNGGCVEGGVPGCRLAHCVGHDGHFDLLKDRGRDTRCAWVSLTPTWVWRDYDLWFSGFISQHTHQQHAFKDHQNLICPGSWAQHQLFRLTINISHLAGVVIVRFRKAGRGVDGEVNIFSKLEQEL